MSRPPRFFGPILLGLAAIAAAPASLTDESDPTSQLLAMPRERRVALSDNLDRFDKLDPVEQAAIRKLDAELGRKDPVDQARYRAVLRRYHLWVNGLTDDQKKALRDAGSDEARFNLARRYRLKEMEKGDTGPRLFGIRTGHFGLGGPYEVANLLRVWNKLSPEKRDEIEKNQERGQLFRAIREQNRIVKAPLVVFPIEEEKPYDARLETDKVFKEQLAPFLHREPLAKKAEIAAAKGETVYRRYHFRYPEFLYFEEHKPKPVKQKNLDRFSTSCPGWLHTMLDPLSPDDARNYLTILYRLLYPDPDEMPLDHPPAKPTKATSTPAPPKMIPKKAGPTGLN